MPHKREALLFGFDPGAPAPLEFRRRDVAERGMAPLGIVVTDVFDDRLPRSSRVLKCTSSTHSTFKVPLTDSIGALSQQSPLRLIDTVTPRAFSFFR